MNVSSDVVILTRAELQQKEDRAFQRGVDRGRFEAGMDAQSTLLPSGEADALRGELERVTKQRDEARLLVTEANNSLHGSQSYFHSTNGGPFDKYHLATPIEALKKQARDERRYAETAEAALAAATIEEAQKVLEPFAQLLVYSFEDDPGTIHVTFDGETLAKLELDSAEGTAALKLEQELAAARSFVEHTGERKT